ncbi:MAG: hypothetical protein K2W85_03915 [Phycisphaerales bacterium]|nr:hypothetical protein [Phycisphaerales bacterium]
MKIRARIGREAVAWLADRPDLQEAFSHALLRICQDELTLVRETVPIATDSDSVMMRAFLFAGRYWGVIAWNHADRAIRVVQCAERLPPPRRPAA